jgi:hypothetical protein
MVEGFGSFILLMDKNFENGMSANLRLVALTASTPIENGAEFKQQS